MQQHIHWRVKSAFVPAIRRHCPRCGGQEFVSSGLFRLNANQNRIDVWLVYRCAGCGNTYNLTLYERVHPAQLARLGVYERLLANDKALAEQTARDTALLKRNGVAPVLQGAEYTIEGPLPRDTDRDFTLTITLPPGMRLRTDRVLGQKLALSRAAVQKHIKKGTVALANGDPCPKYLAGSTTLHVSLRG